MKYIFTNKCVNKYNFNCLVCILQETIAHDLGAERMRNDQEHSKTVIIVLAVTVLEIFNSVKFIYEQEIIYQSLMNKHHFFFCCKKYYHLC